MSNNFSTPKEVTRITETLEKAGFEAFLVGGCVRDLILGTLPKDWDVWFTNANDGSNEGIRHKTKPWRSVQFHPEASPGPTDTAWIFDDFVTSLSKSDLDKQNTHA